MIEIREIEDGESKKSALFIDGNLVDADISMGSIITLSDPTVVELLMSKPISEVTSKSLWLRSFPGMLEWWSGGKGYNNIIITDVTQSATAD